MNNHTSSSITDMKELFSTIRNTRKHEQIVLLLEQAVQNIKPTGIVFPAWISNGERKECEDIDNMLIVLSNEMKLLDNKGMTLIAAPDLFLTRTAYESLGENYVSSLHTSTRNMRTTAKNMDSIRVVFVQAECEIPKELSGLFADVIILSPAKFHSAQLSWLERFVASDTRLIIFDHNHEVDLSANVKINDINRLEFLIARYDIEKDTDEKQALLAYALKYLEVMDAWR